MTITSDCKSLGKRRKKTYYVCYVQYYETTILRCVRKNCEKLLLAPSCLSVSPSVCPSLRPSACMKQLGFHWTDFYEF